jgi:MFS family permease
MRMFVLLCVFLGGLGQGVVNPKLPELLSDHSRLALDSGISASLMYLGIFAASFLYGRLADRGGTFRLLAGGLLLYSAVLFLFAKANSREMVFALRLVEGLALSAVYVSADVVLCRASKDEERGRWLSYYGVALSIGLLAGPATTLIAERFTAGSALSPTLVALAVVTLLCAGACFAFRLPPAVNHAGDSGIERKAALAATLYGFLEAGLVAVLAAVVVKYFLASAERVFIALLLSAVPASLFWGWLIDRIGGRQTLRWVFFTFVVTQAILLCHLVPANILPYAAAASFGIAAGGIYPAGFAWLVQNCGPAQYGYASGLFTRAYGLGSLFGPLAFGFAVEWGGAVGFFALALALGLAGIACASRASNGTAAS